MAQVRVTLWLTRVASERLRLVCARDRVSHTAALQSALECVHLFRLSPERRREIVPGCDPVALEQAVAIAWAEAERLTHRRGLDRVKYVIPYNSDLLYLLRVNRIGKGLPVSLSAAVSTVFLRWPEETPTIRAAKSCVWRWALPRAQARVDARRLGEPELPLGDGLVSSAL